MNTEDGDTEPAPHATASAPTDPAVAGSAPVSLPDAGYDLGDVLGRGGMGEVVSAVDRRIQRSVALKRLRGEVSEHAIRGFLREARIQARLEHPAIVPVHELGIDDAGRPYFTMRKLAGVTLEQRLAERAPIKALLRTLVDVCLAVELAHAHGVVHRDLKPSNIMLGEYGEVYVLDWGVALLLADPAKPDPKQWQEPAKPDPGHPRDPETASETFDDGTQTGVPCGTLGYMAPEQARGERVTVAADVYALGAILFEILAGQHLHPRGPAAYATTLSAPQQAPAQRAPDREIAPELDAACFDALSEDPAARPSARSLADRIQQYLDGDRDLERRAELARELLRQARAAIASGDPEARGAAMNQAGRALALDPASTEAAQLVASMIVQPPPVLPATLVDALAEEVRRVSTERLRVSTYVLVGILGLSTLLPLMEVRNWTTLVVSYAAVVAVVIALWRAYRLRRPNPVLSFVAGITLAFAFSRVQGPFVLTPIVIAGSLLPLSASPWINARPVSLLLWLAVATLGPIALEATGVFATTWSMIDGGVAVTSAVFVGRASTDALVLVITNFVLLCAVAAYGITVHRRLADASQRLSIQIWHLEQMLPLGSLR